MNTKKLLKIVNEILLLEKEHNIQNQLNSILNHYNQNQPDNVNDAKRNIYSAIENSVIFNYVSSDFKILKSIEGYGYFDFSIKENLDEILRSQTHEITQKLTNFIQKRNELFQKLQSLKSALQGLGVKLDFLNDNVYYVIFAFPEKYHDLGELQKALADFDLFLREIASNSESGENYKISSVNDGCIEFFIEAGHVLANTVSVAVDYVLEIYACIKLYEDGKERYKNYKKKRKDTIEKEEKAEMEEKRKELFNDFIKSLNLKNPEEESRIKGLFSKIIKHFEAGVSAEVKTPLIEEPREAEEGDDKETTKQLKEERKVYEERQKIEERNKKFYLIQKEQKLLLDMPDNNEELSK